MSILTENAAYTPEDLLQMDGLFELVDGQVVEKHLSFLAGKASSRISYLLLRHLEGISTGGEVGTEVTIQCFPDNPDQVRRPDILFFSAERAAAVPDEGHVRIAPDLVIEVISPGDKINEFEEKLADYRSAKIKLVWEVNPTFQHVRIHHPDGSSVFLQANDTLTGESVLPTFSIKVADLMPRA